MATSFVIIFSLLTTTLLSQISNELPDCECITGWNSDDLNCESAVIDGTIDLLQQYLTISDVNCFKNCNSNFQCQQAFSLLSQYYDYCPLNTVSQQLIRSKYWQHSVCTDCKIIPFHQSSSNPECTTINNCTSNTLKGSIQDSVDYVAINCNSDNITNSSNDYPIQCTTKCNDEWLNITSFLRHCRESINDNTLLDNIYSNDNTNCIRDCNHIEMFDLDGYTLDCSINKNANYSVDFELNGKLDLDNIKQETMLCFYGLNINDPTNYELICVERADFNTSGIKSYNKVNEAVNTSYWSTFGIANDMDQLWVLICGALVFFMQLGFTLLEAGTVKSGNVQNILFKNIMDACIGAIVFYIIGYCVAYGDDTSPDSNGFIGVEDVLIESGDFNSWFFQWAFAATAATIVSGAVAERCHIEAYFIYTIVISTWIYPIVVHWVWSGTGWISPFNPNPSLYAGAIDFAGSAVVHMVGGFCGLMGAFWLGPRFRRFDTSKAATDSKYYHELMHQFEFGHNVPFQVLGTLILWFGWYGFNAGSTLAANNAMNLASKVAVTTTLAAGTGGLTSATLARIFQKSWHIPRVCNGILAALVSITASCAVVSPGVAIVIGFIGALVYYGASNLLEYILEIDDPLDAFAVHGCGGMWGVLSVGIFAIDKNIEFAGYSEALWKDTNHGQRFATQLVLVICVAGWTMINAGILFAVLYYLDILRIEESVERSGIDIHEHGGSAINMRTAYKQKKSLSNVFKKKKKNNQDDLATIIKKEPKKMVQIDEENEEQQRTENAAFPL